MILGVSGAAVASPFGCDAFGIVSPMEVGNHGVHHLDVNREPDKVAKNLNLPIQEFVAQTVSPVATATDVTAPLHITPAAKVVSDFAFSTVTNDLNIAPVETPDPTPISTMINDDIIAPTDAQDPSPISADDGYAVKNVVVSQELSASQAPTEQPDMVAAESEMQPVAVDMAFDDMVVLKDGMVTIAAPLVEGEPPLVQSGDDDPVPSPHTEDGSLVSDVLAMELADAPAKDSLSDKVLAQQQEDHDETYPEILSQRVSDMDEPSGVGVVLEEQEGGEALTEDVLGCEVTNNDVQAAEVTDRPKVADKQSADGSLDDKVLISEPTQTLSEVVQEGQTEITVEDDGEKPEVCQEDVEAFKGRKVLKRFGKEDFIGDVVGYEPVSKWFKIVYEDGDEEELERVEVEAILLPLGSLPATTSRKRPHPGGAVEEGSKKAKKLKVETPQKKSAPSGSKKQGQLSSGGKKGRSQGSKNVSKSPGTKAIPPGSKGKVISKKQTPTKKLKKAKGKHTGSGNKQATPKSTGKQGEKPEQSMAIAGEFDFQSRKDSSKVVQKKKGQKEKKTGLDASKSSKAVSTKNNKHAKAPGGQKSKASKGLQAKTEKPLQEKSVEKSVGKSKSKGGRNSGTGTTLQEGIKRYLQKVEENTRQKLKSGVKRKSDSEDNGRSKSKRLKKSATESPKSQTKLDGEGAKQPKGRAREAKHETPGGDDQEGIEPEGATLIGRTTRKKFSGKFFSGEVVGYDKKTKFYKVRYEDGDQEDLEWSELEPTLVSQGKRDVDMKATSAKKSSSSRPVSQKTSIKEPLSQKTSIKATGERKKGQQLRKSSRNGAVTRSKGGAKEA